MTLMQPGPQPPAARSSFGWVRTKVGIAVLLVVAGVATGLHFALRPDFCDGLPREMGACSRSRPQFSGTTCAEVGSEWGRQLDERVMPLIERPFSGVSSKLLDAEILTIQLANQHMRDNGITPHCSVAVFFSAGEAQLSEALKSEVGDLVYEGNPVVSYLEWQERSIDMVELILSIPDAPYNPYDD